LLSWQIDEYAPGNGNQVGCEMKRKAIYGVRDSRLIHDSKGEGNGGGETVGKRE
jgi:hypothetical protein